MIIRGRCRRLYTTRAGMSAVVVESLKHTSWAGPLQVLAHAPGPNASGPEQPKPPGQWLRPPPRLPKPPPVFGDAAGAALDGAVAQGEILASAAVEGVAKLFGSTSEIPRRELLLSRRHAQPLTALRRVHARSARRLLQYEKDIESNNTAPKLHVGKHIHDTANATLGYAWLHEIASEAHSIDSLHIALAVTLVVLLFILAVGVLRGWWRKEDASANTVPLQYAEFPGEKAHNRSNYDI